MVCEGSVHVWLTPMQKNHGGKWNHGIQETQEVQRAFKEKASDDEYFSKAATQMYLIQ